LELSTSSPSPTLQPTSSVETSEARKVVREALATRLNGQ
jgi:hypothetical protein